MLEADKVIGVGGLSAVIYTLELLCINYQSSLGLRCAPRRIKHAQLSVTQDKFGEMKVGADKLSYVSG